MSEYGSYFDIASAQVRALGVCERCGKTFRPSQLDAHHVIPRGYGGSDAPDNLVSVCDKCHPQAERASKAAYAPLPSIRIRPRRRSTALIKAAKRSQPRYGP
jgi:5-methylcytosine-specific restriction endonuclease McrA